MPPTANDILMKCGSFGRFQLGVLILLAVASLPSAFITYLPMFILTIPKHRCTIEGLQNDTYAVQSPAHLVMINGSIPWEDEDEGIRSSCYRYSSEYVNGTRSKVGCSDFVFDKSFFENSFIEKFDIVCDKNHWRSTANSMMMAGKLAAAFTQGIISDRFGRRKSVLFLIVLTFIVGVTSAFPMDIPSLLVSRLLSGFCTTGIYLAIYVTALEFLCPHHRRMFLVVWGVVWVAGGLILTGVAYFVRDSQNLTLIVTTPCVLLLSYYWLLPESPRWLLSTGNTKRAREVFKRIAKTNGKEFPEELFDEVAAQVQKVNVGKKTAVKDDGDSCDDVIVKDKEPKENLMVLLRYKKMLFFYCILMFNWMANSLTYYALMFNVSNLPGSIYTNFMLLNFVDVASSFLSYFVLDRFGRKWSYGGFLMCAVVGCLLCMVPVFLAGSHSTAIFNGLALLGRAGISASFNIVYLYSAELFPTSVRSTTMGTFNMSSKIGSMFSPYIADLGILIGGHFKEVLPMLVCGGIALTALVLSLFLPETVGKDLPNTVADVIRVNKISDKRYQKCPQTQSMDILEPGSEKL